MKFNKPPQSFEEQLDLLIKRGLIVDDRDEALHYLKHLNYYRLIAYWLPFEKSRDPHEFLPGTHFSQIINNYLFDRELRLLLLDAIERIEISFRTQWAYHVSHAIGPHGYLNATKGSIKDPVKFKKDKNELQLNISHLSNGVYTLKIKTEKGETYFTKIVKE